MLNEMGFIHVKAQCSDFLWEERRPPKQVLMLEFHPVTSVTQGSDPAPSSVPCNILLPHFLFFESRKPVGSGMWSISPLSRPIPSLHRGRDIEK
jgi:hypothetical protein